MWSNIIYVVNRKIDNNTDSFWDFDSFCAVLAIDGFGFILAIDASSEFLIVYLVGIIKMHCGPFWTINHYLWPKVIVEEF